MSSAKHGVAEGRMQIGDIAEHTGLSLRTIRYYEEAGLVTPSTRTTGGFRLYGSADVERLQLIKRTKPLGFSLDEMRELLHVLDELDEYAGSDTGDALRARLEYFTDMVEQRCERLREQLQSTVGLADLLRARSARRPDRIGRI